MKIPFSKRLAIVLGICAVTTAIIFVRDISAKECDNTSSNPGNRPRLLLSLPDDCNVPDGMRLDPKTGDVILAFPNFKIPKYPGKLMKITPDNRLESYYDRLPVHPHTGKTCPMGLDFGPDGNLYVADNQYFFDKNYQSRLIRVNVRDGKPVGAEVVVDGFKLSNGVMWKGDMLYVTETFFDLPGKPGVSGVYRFSLDELNHGVVTLKHKDQDDPHLLFTLQTHPDEMRRDFAGADGITFDQEGNLYVGKFGDGEVFKIIFESNGSIKSKQRVVGPPRMTCADGMYCDLRTGKVYVTDSQNNAIQVISPDGSVETLWENDDTTGECGLLDQPCEVLVRGNDLIISNFDYTFPGLKNRQNDAFHTVSVILLK